MGILPRCLGWSRTHKLKRSAWLGLPEWWDDRCEPLYLALFFFLKEYSGIITKGAKCYIWSECKNCAACLYLYAFEDLS